MKKATLAVGVPLIALLVFAGLAYASTVLWVGKGDVQTVLGWNNGTLQANAASLVWSYDEQTTIAVVCERENQNNTVTQNRNGTRSVMASITVDPRANRNGQVTGFELTIGAPVYQSTGNTACPAAEGWVEISRTEVATGSGLTVNGAPLGIVLQ